MNMWIAPDRDNLYRPDQSLSYALDATKREAEQTVRNIPQEDFLAMSDQEILEIVSEKHSVELLRLGEPEITPPQENGSDFVVYQKTPFTGDPALLTHWPSTWTNPPSGTVKNPRGSAEGEIKVTLHIRGYVLDEPLSREKIEEEFKQNNERLTKMAGWANSDAQKHNIELAEYITPAIVLRRKRLENAATSI